MSNRCVRIASVYTNELAAICDWDHDTTQSKIQ
jgi:hypothetical protein